MKDPLRDRVVQAVAQADEQPTAAFGAQNMLAEPEPTRLLEVADLELIIGRHRRLAREEGYQAGARDGYSHGSASTQLIANRRLAVAATQIIGRLNALVDGVLDVLAPREDEGKRDRRSRDAIRLEAYGILKGASEIRDVLSDLTELINP